MIDKGTAEYARNHNHVGLLWGGKAREFQCIICFDPAVAWSHLWRTHPDKTNPYNYVPMCQRDHDDYDYELHADIGRAVMYDNNPSRWAGRRRIDTEDSDALT